MLAVAYRCPVPLPPRRRQPDLPDPVRVREVLVDGLPVHTRAAEGASQDAPVVVLVHGLGMSGRTMEPLLRRLAPYARVYVPDLPGFGASGKPRRTLEVEELADALHAWVGRSGINPLVYVGHSLGCQVIGHLALRHPGSVPSAVWVAPTRDPEVRTVTAYALRLLRDAPREPLSLLGLAVFDYLRSSPVRVLKTLADAIVSPVRPQLPALGVPVLVVRGEHDPVVPRRFCQKVVDLLPDCRLTEVPDAAHGAPYSHPDEVARIVLDFVAGAKAD